MPEMPEVEAVRRVLEPQLRGRRVASVAIAQPQIVAHPGPDGFASAVEGREIVGMGRRGKFLTMALGDGGTIVLHLRMTGHLLVLPANFPVQKHTHLVMGLSDGMEVRYVDPRRFGRFWYLAPGEEDAVTGMAKLGPEPLDAAFTGSYLKEKAGSRSKAVKEALHDQSVVAGIGNIYSDEILFDARVNPLQGPLGAALEQAGTGGAGRDRVERGRERDDARGIPGGDGRSVPQHGARGGVWPRGRAVPAVREHGEAHGNRGSRQLLLPALPAETPAGAALGRGVCPLQGRRPEGGTCGSAAGFSMERRRVSWTCAR